MDYFSYRGGVLHAEDVPLTAIAAEVGTPFYCYSRATIERHYNVMHEQFAGLDHRICFAVKANSNLAVLRTLARLGAGADTVSEGEIRRALAAGIPAERIVFSGVGKTAQELQFGLEHAIFQFNVESEPELRLLSDIAARMGKTARVVLRVNPDVEAKTHAKITTGLKTSKFGITMEQARGLYREAQRLPGIDLKGVSVHIGSQIIAFDAFEAAFTRVASFVEELRADGVPVQSVDLGGGIGIRYAQESHPDLERYAAIVKRTVGHLGCELVFEPGRIIVGNAGVLVSEVIYLKQTEARDFLIIDAAMNDLMRPSLYGAYHEIVPLREPLPGAVTQAVDVVGPVCESSDLFAEQRTLPPLQPGDLLAFRSAGAYGAVMSSTYNTRPLIPEVLVDGGRWSVIRPRVGYEELLRQDRIPDWLE